MIDGPATLLAQATDAEREANAIWAKIDAARGASNALRPAGFEHEIERASDLVRRARALRTDAAEFAQDSATAPAARNNAPEFTAPAPVVLALGGAGVVDPVEVVAARVLASDEPSSEEVARQIIAAADLAEGLDPAAYPLSEAEQAAAIVERILKS